MTRGDTQEIHAHNRSDTILIRKEISFSFKWTKIDLAMTRGDTQEIHAHNRSDTILIRKEISVSSPWINSEFTKAGRV